jgi:hypothetical protein
MQTLYFGFLESTLKELLSRHKRETTCKYGKKGSLMSNKKVVALK